MATNYVEQILELEAQQKNLEDQKKKILVQAKAQALQSAEKAVADLNNLGFNYKLVEASTATRTATSTRASSPRQGGISEQVLAVIKDAPDGLPRAGVLSALNASDTKAEQSISNALSNLKKKGQLTAENGTYRAV